MADNITCPSSMAPSNCISAKRTKTHLEQVAGTASDTSSMALPKWRDQQVRFQEKDAGLVALHIQLCCQHRRKGPMPRDIRRRPGALSPPVQFASQRFGQDRGSERKRRSNLQRIHL